MEWCVTRDAPEAELAAAAFIAQTLALAIEARGSATLAISGGRSPWRMFDRLSVEEVGWGRLHLFQVDERIVPAGDPERNWSHFVKGPLAARIPARNLHPMPVELDDVEQAVGRYSATLAQWAGVPPRLDVVHLGIGQDGHTASLFADDVLLEDRRHWVGVSRPYQGHRRLTLTLPVLNAARTVVWFSVGSGRRAILERLQAADPGIAASHVRRERAVVFTDQDAAPAV